MKRVVAGIAVDHGGDVDAERLGDARDPPRAPG